MKLTMANETVVVDGIKIALYKSNLKHKNTIILLHGYCGSSAYYSKLVPLVEQYANVIAFDLFGHGQSDYLQTEKYRLEDIALLIHKAILELNIKQYYLLGHSLGGYITLAYAKQFAYALSGFGLIHSTARPDSEEAKTNRLNVIRSVKEEGVTPFATQLVSKLFGNQPQEEDVLLAREIGLNTTTQAVIGFAHAMREREDATDIIHNTTLPVLLIAGEQDKIVNPQAVFAGHQASTICEIVKDAGHMGMLEAEHEIAAIIERFIGN